MSTILPSNIDYSTYSIPQPRYKYVKLTPSNLNTSNFTISATSGTEVQFKMPYNTVFNLSQSYLAYTLTGAAQGGTDVAWSCEDTMDIVGPQSSVSFETGEGLKLVDIQSAGKVIRLMRKLKTSYQNLVNGDTTSGLYPMSVTGAKTITATNASTGNVTLDSTYVIPSAANTAIYKYKYYPLGALPALFEIDKDLFFNNRDMYFKFTTASGNQIFWKGANTTNPTATAAAATTDVAVSGLCLYLAVEQNPQIIDSVRSKFDSGNFTINTDYIVVSRNLTTSANSNVLVNYTPAFGHTLKKVIHTVWNGAEEKNTNYDCDNTNASKVVSYMTYLDSTQLQDQLVSCAAPATTNIGLDDWRINKQHLNNSYISNYQIYQANWFHCDNFSVNPNNPEFERYKNNTIDGLPLERAITYSIQATTANANHIHLTIGVFGRRIRATNDYVQFE